MAVISTVADLEAENVRYQADRADEKSSRWRRRLGRVVPLRLFADARPTLVAAEEVPPAPGAAPPAGDDEVFIPRDAHGKLLATPVRSQKTLEPSCTGHCVASMMELWLCRARKTSLGVPHLHVGDLWPSGRAELLATAAVAEKGVSEEGYAGPADKRDEHVWKLDWRNFDGYEDELVDPMCRAIVEQGPLGTSIRLWSDFDSYVDGSGPYSPGRRATSNLIFHAVCIYGFDRREGVWLVRNSNSAWGSGGYGKIAFNDEKVRPQRLVIGVKTVTPKVATPTPYPT